MRIIKLSMILFICMSKYTEYYSFVLELQNYILRQYSSVKIQSLKSIEKVQARQTKHPLKIFKSTFPRNFSSVLIVRDNNSVQLKPTQLIIHMQMDILYFITVQSHRLTTHCFSFVRDITRSILIYHCFPFTYRITRLLYFIFIVPVSFVTRLPTIVKHLTFMTYKNIFSNTKFRCTMTVRLH